MKRDKHTMQALSANPGTYALTLSLNRAMAIEVGRLGIIHFSSGWYVYVGSAMGPGGVAARVGRHLKHRKKVHWHIDYLRPAAHVVGVMWVMGTPKKECGWALLLGRKPFFGRHIKGFGCSDCKCDAHLLYYPKPLNVERVARHLKSNWVVVGQI